MSRPDQPLTSSCEGYLTQVQLVLDRQADAALLDDAHAFLCPHCSGIREAAGQLQDWERSAPALTVPAKLTEQLVNQLNHEAARQRRIRWAWRSVGLVTVLGLVVLFAWPSKTTLEIAPPPKPTVTPIKPSLPESRLEDRLSEVGQAVASATKQVTTDSLRPAQNLFAWPSGSSLIVTTSATTTTGDSILEMPQSAKAGLEPVAAAPKRAVNRLLLDLSALTPSKPK